MSGLILASLACFAALSAQPAAAREGDQKRLTAAEIAALPTIEAGAGTSGVSGIRTTVLAGNPSVSSAYTIMLQIPANTRIAAHTHRDTRSAIVISGTWYFGYGTAASDTQAKALGPHSFYTEPANAAHFARTGMEPVVLYISGVGPTDTQYVAIKDAPTP